MVKILKRCNQSTVDGANTRVWRKQPRKQFSARGPTIKTITPKTRTLVRERKIESRVTVLDKPIRAKRWREFQFPVPLRGLLQHSMQNHNGRHSCFRRNHLHALRGGAPCKLITSVLHRGRWCSDTSRDHHSGDMFLHEKIHGHELLKIIMWNYCQQKMIAYPTKIQNHAHYRIVNSKNKKQVSVLFFANRQKNHRAHQWSITLSTCCEYLTTPNCPRRDLCFGNTCRPETGDFRFGKLHIHLKCFPTCVCCWLADNSKLNRTSVSTVHSNNRHSHLVHGSRELCKVWKLRSLLNNFSMVYKAFSVYHRRTMPLFEVTETCKIQHFIFGSDLTPFK